MSGERLARISLRVDAVYCLVLGTLVGSVAPLVGPPTQLPVPLLAGVGLATAGWGGFVWWAASRRPIGATARFVMVANLAASGLLAVTGLVAGTTALALAASVLAFDVAAFAVSQGVALRRMRGATA